MLDSGVYPADMADPLARATPETRAAALAVYEAQGLAVAHAETGIPKTTLRRWARAEGLDPHVLAGEDVARTEAANKVREARIIEARREIQEQLLVQASDMLDRMNEPHIDYRGKESDRVEFEKAPADACRHYAISAAVLIDKFRLEMGESTSRSEIVGATPEKARERLGEIVTLAQAS